MVFLIRYFVFMKNIIIYSLIILLYSIVYADNDKHTGDVSGQNFTSTSHVNSRWENVTADSSIFSTLTAKTDYTNAYFAYSTFTNADFSGANLTNTYFNKSFAQPIFSLATLKFKLDI